MPPAVGQAFRAPPGRVAVAYSGGLDSLALLHATCRAARNLGLQVVALHVHHGLQPQADAWLRAAEDRVARWRRRGWPVELLSTRLQGQPAAGDSVEAWARAGRHAALARLAQQAGATLLLLAHHRRDQAETVVLQLLRGGGPAGLAAMPAQAQRGALLWARPWLQQPRQAIAHYAQRHRLVPVQDPSNDDVRWARNRLRHRVWPVLEQAFAGVEVALAAAARRAQEAQAALAELATQDLAACCGPDRRLQVSIWRELSPARQANALRAWWQAVCGRGAPETAVQRLLAELPGGVRAAHPGASWPAVHGWRVRLHQGGLQLHAELPAQRPSPAAVRAPDALAMRLDQPGHWPVPAWQGSFWIQPCNQGGIALADLRLVLLRPRRGGEQFQCHARSTARSLKKQFQAAGVPSVGRLGPLVWQGERLLYVPGLGTDARALAAPGAPQCVLTWQPAAAEQLLAEAELGDAASRGHDRVGG